MARLVYKAKNSRPRGTCPHMSPRDTSNSVVCRSLCRHGFQAMKITNNTEGEEKCRSPAPPGREGERPPPIGRPPR